MDAWITGLLSLFIVLQIAVLVILVVTIYRVKAKLAEKLPPVEISQASTPVDMIRAPQYGSVLRVEMGDDKGSFYKLKPRGSTWIGRDDNANDITVPNSAVSRRHCRVESDGAAFYVHDLGSTNGTFLNGQPIRTSVLRHGDTLSVGSTVFRFLKGPEEGSPVH